MLVSGALALALADLIPWRAVYLLMAAFMTVGAATTLLCREPEMDAPPPRTLREAVVEPFVEFFRRKGAWLILAFILLYKIGDQMASAMTTPFFLELGFSKTDIAAVVKAIGMASMIAGGFAGAYVMLKVGIRRSLWAFGFLQAASILAFAGLAQAGKVYGMLAAAVACFPIFVTGREIARWEGLLFLAYYIAYTAWLILRATHNDAAGPYGAIMAGFVVPLTFVTLAILSYRHWRQTRRASGGR